MNVAATIRAMQHSLQQVEFGRAVLFTDDRDVDAGPSIELVAIERLDSSAAYSQFVLQSLVDHIATPHCLVVQWDGFVTHRECWNSEFLQYDYIGAPWPQFNDGWDVGNGGFSLRSRALLQACRDRRFSWDGEAEDLAICRRNRVLLEQHRGVRFADADTAARFSQERAQPHASSFGFHGVFNMIKEIGPDAFWKVYETLDHKQPVFQDFLAIAADLIRSPRGLQRVAGMARDRLRA